MELRQFLDTSYTAYHSTANVCEILKQNGFVRLSLEKDWKLQPDGKYYVTRNDSSVIAFRIGQNKVFNVCESHTDSPSFKVKGNCIVDSIGEIKRLDTEKYGGGIMYTYFDRPLKVAGRIVEKTPDGVITKLVASSYNVVIPSLAIHFNPDVNKGFDINTQSDTLPFLGQSCNDLYKTFSDNQVLDADLFVVPATSSFVAGQNDEFLCSARIDNLTSVFASITALCNCTPQDIAVVACLDNEEIGSTTRQGAPSFIDSVLTGIATALNMNFADNYSARENGFVLSVDNGHATHPAHTEKGDPNYQIKLNGGIIIKHYVNYATDGLTSAIVKCICDNAQVKYQDLYNRSDGRGGSTLGLVTARQLGMRACDIGIPQLAMHSACETCGLSDIAQMEKFIIAYLSAKLQGDNDITIK